MKVSDFETLVSDSRVDHRPGARVHRVRESDWWDVDCFAGDCFAAQHPVTAPAFEQARRHHHVPGRDRVDVAHAHKRPKQRQNDRKCEKRVFDLEPGHCFALTSLYVWKLSTNLRTLRVA